MVGLMCRLILNVYFILMIFQAEKHVVLMPIKNAINF